MKEITRFKDSRGVTHASRQEALLGDLIGASVKVLRTKNNSEVAARALVQILEDSKTRNQIMHALQMFDTSIGQAKVLDHADNVQRGFS